MSPKEFGKQLKNMREGRNLTLDDMEARYGLKGELIFLLEKGEPAGLVFVKDILLKYQEVFAPKTDLLETYRGVLEDHDKYPHATLRELNLVSFQGFFLVFVTVLAVYFVTMLVGSIRPPSVVAVGFPEETTIVRDPRFTLTLRVEPKDATVYINRDDYFPDDEGYIRKELMLSPGVNSLAITAVNRLNNKTTIQKRIVYQEGE